MILITTVPINQSVTVTVRKDFDFFDMMMTQHFFS